MSSLSVEPQKSSAGLWERYPSVPYVAPFLVFLGLLATSDQLKRLGRWEYVLWVAILTAVLWVFSRGVISFRAPHWAGSIATGIGVFVLWIGPDLLFPGYRQHWLFQNSLTGQLASSIAPQLVDDPLVLIMRIFRAVVLVAIIEELFWRGWLMRWLVHSDFRSVPLGTYAASAFWITAVLFASEHGPYWDVGLLTGIIYNWWMIRTRSLGDCILMHGVTNACLSAYVLATGRWEYWM